jgi:predicted MFS family arabinose efflux permease
MMVAAGVNASLLGLLAVPDSLTPLLWFAFVAWRVTQIALFAVMLTAASDVLRPERRTQGLALFGLSGLIALTTGGLIGDAVRGAVGFSGLILTAAALAALSLLVKSFVPSEAFGGPPMTGRRSFWYALAQRDLLPLWLVTFGFAIGMQALFTFLPTYVEAEGIGSLGSYFMVYGALAALVRIFGSGALDRFDARRLIIVTSLGYGFGVGLLAATGSEAAFVASAAIAGLAHGVLFPVMTSQVVARARDSERGSALAAFTALFDVGLVAMAPVVGQLIDLSGYTAGFGFVGVSVLAVTSAYGVWDRRHAIAAIAA